MRVGPKKAWKVSLTEDKLYIGKESFRPSTFRLAIESFYNGLENFRTLNYELIAKESGVWYNNQKLSWNDIKNIHKFLIDNNVKVGDKD